MALRGWLGLLQNAIGASEHNVAESMSPSPVPDIDDTRGNAQIIWSMQEALDFRAGFRGQQAASHKEARDALNNLTSLVLQSTGSAVAFIGKNMSHYTKTTTSS